MMINLLLAQAGSIIPGEKRGRVNRIFILLTLTLLTITLIEWNF